MESKGLAFTWAQGDVPVLCTPAFPALLSEEDDNTIGLLTW